MVIVTRMTSRRPTHRRDEGRGVEIGKGGMERVIGYMAKGALE